MCCFPDRNRRDGGVKSLLQPPKHDIFVPEGREMDKT